MFTLVWCEFAILPHNPVHKQHPHATFSNIQPWRQEGSSWKSVFDNFLNYLLPWSENQIHEMLYDIAAKDVQNWNGTCCMWVNYPHNHLSEKQKNRKEDYFIITIFILSCICPFIHSIVPFLIHELVHL